MAKKCTAEIWFWCAGCGKVVKRRVSKFAAVHSSWCGAAGKIVVMKRASQAAPLVEDKGT